MKLFAIALALLASAASVSAAPATPAEDAIKRAYGGHDGSADDPYWCKNNWANCHRKRAYGGHDGSADDPYWCKNNWANCKRNEDFKVVDA